ncbi:MAG: hypothetical protein Alpg2KO_00870 [Alphaproteobacteria bacterium]
MTDNQNILAELTGNQTKVEIAGKALSLTGLSLQQIGAEIGRSPDLAAAIEQGQIELSALLTAAPDACARLIARGLDMPDTQEALVQVSALPAGHQILLLRALWEISFPGKSAAVMQGLFGQLTSSGKKLTG